MSTPKAEFQFHRDPSVDGFCRRMGFSRSHFYNLLARGEGPRLFHVGKLTRISEEAERDFVRQREAAELPRSAPAAERRSENATA